MPRMKASRVRKRTTRATSPLYIEIPRADFKELKDQWFGPVMLKFSATDDPNLAELRMFVPDPPTDETPKGDTDGRLWTP